MKSIKKKKVLIELVLLLLRLFEGALCSSVEVLLRNIVVCKG